MTVLEQRPGGSSNHSNGQNDEDYGNFAFTCISIPLTSKFYFNESKNLSMSLGLKIDIILDMAYSLVKNKILIPDNRSEHHDIDGVIVKGTYKVFEENYYDNQKLSNGTNLINNIRYNLLWSVDYETTFGLTFALEQTIWITKFVNPDPDFSCKKTWTRQSDDNFTHSLVIGINLVRLTNFIFNAKETNKNE